MTTKSGTVNAVKLTDFTTEALKKVGVPEEDARITAPYTGTTNTGIF